MVVLSYCLEYNHSHQTPNDMKSVRITIGVILLLLSLMFVSCSSESGKREPKSPTVTRVVRELDQHYVISREIDTTYQVGDTIRVLFANTRVGSRMALVVVVR